MCKNLLPLSFVCLSFFPSLPPFFFLHLKKSFLNPTFPRKHWITGGHFCHNHHPSHFENVCACVYVYFANACCFAVCVCVCGYYGPEGASQGKWVFEKKKAQKEPQTCLRGKEEKSTLALWLQHIRTHTHGCKQSTWCTTLLLLLRSDSEKRELCTYWTEPRERHHSDPEGINFCPGYKRGITGFFTALLSSEKHKHTYSWGN